jgi:vacuolar-type H+-ATPase subunit I/STV1
MSVPSEQTQTFTKGRDADIIRQASQDLESQADSLLDEAREVDSEQSNLVDTSPLDSQYNAALQTQVDAKHDQAERIEDRLEILIEVQASRLQLIQSQQPGILALTSTRQLWQQQVQQQQNTMQKLRGRLEVVREIKEGMGIHSPRIEELAAHKLKFKEPSLSSDWIDMQEAQRWHQVLMRKQEQDKKRLLNNDVGDSERQYRCGLSQRLGG